MLFKRTVSGRRFLQMRLTAVKLETTTASNHSSSPMQAPLKVARRKSAMFQVGQIFEA